MENDSQIIRVVSWNVADNKYMDGEIKNDAIQKLLGLYKDEVRQLRKPADSYFLRFLSYSTLIYYLGIKYTRKKEKKPHQLTRKVKVIAYKGLIIWYGLPKP